MGCGNDCKCGGGGAAAPLTPPPNYKEMQAISVILNPNTVDRANVQKTALIWQSLPNGTLGYDQVNFDGKHGAPRDQEIGEVIGYYGLDSTLAPKLKFGSSLVSIVLHDIVHTYGVLQSDSSIWLLSPILMPVQNAKVAYGNISGCSDGKSNGWLYWQEPPAVKGDKAYIKELDLNHPENEPRLLSKTELAKENTSIVAVHDGTFRYLVFQTSVVHPVSKKEEQSDIVVHNLDRETSDLVRGAHEILDERVSRLAALYANGRIWVYYNNKRGLVYRSSAEVKDDEALAFGLKKDLKNNLNLHESTGLAVLGTQVGASKTGNYLYAVKAGGKTITVTHDPWEDK